jgi:hypothetical protein
MAENVAQPVEVPVPLQLFGGLVTEMAPSDLPEGVSPDCQDLIFFPGGISSRPGLEKWVSDSVQNNLFPPNTTVTYEKSFITPNGDVKNLFLTSDGSFFVQDRNSPEILTQILSVTPGSYASSISSFGKEFIVFHDNISGTDIPRIYDGVNIDRATQCGPPLPPTVINTVIPSTTMAITAVPGSVAVSFIETTDQVFYGPSHSYTYYSTVTIDCASTASLSVGSVVTISGNSNGLFNTGFVVTQIFTTSFKCNARYFTYESGVGGHFTATGGITAIRSNNQVSVTTSTPNGLNVGFQVQISDMPASVVGTSIVSITINNEVSNGIATIVTSSDHGLLPENAISINGVANTAVGGAITAIARSGEVVTVSTTSAHGLSVGAFVRIAGVTDTTYNGSFFVSSVPSTTSFTYSQVDVDSTSTGGTVSLVWPVTNTGILQNYYTVISVPNSTTFTVEISYNDGVWTGGTVTFAWNGTFYVTQILSPTSFTYQQYGPNASSSALGTVTPYSQVPPGLRQCVVMYQTRSGYITKPSAPFSFISNGGQYLTISNIPIGPPNVIKRIIAFTGADGQNFFYISNPAFISGIIISTSTTVEDNSTTSVLVDFSDNTLFASTAIDIPGNNLFEMAVIGPSLGVTSYASRAAWWGMRNSIQNLVNLGFEGGFYTSLLQPLGWDVISAGGTLNTVMADFGYAWQIQGSGVPGQKDGMITQTGYQDVYGVAVLQPSTQYGVGFRSQIITTPGGTGGFIGIDIYSAGSGGVLASTNIAVTSLSNSGKFYYLDLTGTLPAAIPADTVVRLYTQDVGIGTQVNVDEMEFYPTANPILPQFLFSYVNFPEQLDLITGVLGASDDDTLIQGTFIYRDSLLVLTQFGLHETSDLAGFEPNGWRVREVSRNCGACGPKAITTGENFSCWVTSPSGRPPVGRGLYIYTGGAVYKLSQEVQPDFDRVNTAAQQCIWTTNDSVTRRIYLGMPLDGATAPNWVYVLDYREMDTASEIASKSPIHISFTGKMICSDLSRKWTRWSFSANCGEIMVIPALLDRPTSVQMSFGTGNGLAPGQASGFANCYNLNSNLLTDQDYGTITPYYITYFFVNHEQEQNLQVGLHRKLYKRYYCYINGVGNLQITPYGDNLSNPWPLTPALPMSLNQLYDLGDGLNVIADRVAFRISSLPLPGTTDNSFNLTKFIVTMMQEPIAPLRFGAI